MANTSHIPGFGRSVLITAAPVIVCAAPFVFDGLLVTTLPVCIAIASSIVALRLSDEKRNDRIALVVYNESAASVAPVGTYPMQREVFALLRPAIHILAQGVSWVPALPQKWRLLRLVALFTAVAVALAGAFAAQRTLPLAGDWRPWLPQLLLLAPVLAVAICRPGLPEPALADEKAFADLICAWLLRSADPVNGGTVWLTHLISQGLDVSGKLIKMKIEEVLAQSGMPPDCQA